MENTLVQRLKTGCAEEWRAYVEHDFTRGLADGTLSQASFKHYLIQDYLFLKHFSRAWALMVYKAEDVAAMQSAVGVLDGLLNHEMALHLDYCAQWGIERDQLEATPEARANMAYTRYVLDAGMAGDRLDLLTTLAPCVVGYAEIGLECAHKNEGALDQHPYAHWIKTYSGDEFQELARDVREQMDTLFSTRGGEHRLASLQKLFTDATRLEQSFWDMGLHQSW